MACFPRLFPRQKNSFNPAEDDNTDTLLNPNESTVQIGRYIRREETPLFTPKSSERLRRGEPLLQVQPPHQSVTSRHTINSSSSSNNNVQKKFISQREKLQSSSFNSSNGHISTSYTNFKLKPVKERRPTALPTDALRIPQNDEVDGARSPVSLTPISTPTLHQVKFFIGSQGDDDTSCSEVPEVRVSAAESAETQKSTTRASAGSNAHASTTKSAPTLTLTTPATTPTTPTTTGSAIFCFRARKPQQRPPPHKAAQQGLHIPIPPPIPPQPLTTASSCTSLVSNRSWKTKRPSSKPSTNSKLLSLPHAAAPATNYNHDLESCTLAEMLSSSYSTVTTNTTTTAEFSSNGRDSGVQVEFYCREYTPTNTPTPDDDIAMGTPKSQRVEGGLIYARPKLPVKKDVPIEYIQKDEATRNLIRTAIEKNDFLNNYMDKERKELVIDAMAPATYDKDSFIINENDEGSEIYVSEEGEFEVIKSLIVIGSFGMGTVFGELAILYNAKRFASIKAKTHARVWKIERDTFRKIMVISGSKEREENLNFLRSAPILNNLSAEVLSKVVDLLQRKFYETGACIVREGEVGNEFFIIRGGTVTIKKMTLLGTERVVGRRKRGDYFGEQALLNADRRQASVYADAPGTEVLNLDREAFISYLGTIPQLHEKPMDHNENVNGESPRKSEFNNAYAHIDLKELKKVATLGAGAFGRVDLVAFDHKTFALKIIKKIEVIKQDQVEHVYNEKLVMMKCLSSPFIVELYKTFRNDKFVYFLMEACMGGDVWTVMSQRRFFDEKTARFIAGCVVEAFDFLHSRNIIYRDLKPENLMLTTDGYCKLVDFGFAKQIPQNQKTNTFAGTPEYVAPEIILDRGHDRSVDYWALGILIFELLVGKTPFRGQNQIKIYQQILGGIDVIQMPSKIPKSAQGLIKHLCKQLPAERLGYQRRGILDIKRHSWFEGLDWHKLKNKLLSSPIKRPITSNTDLRYFVAAGMEHDHEPPDETSGWDINF